MNIIRIEKKAQRLEDPHAKRVEEHSLAQFMADLHDEPSSCDSENDRGSQDDEQA